MRAISTVVSVARTVRATGVTLVAAGTLLCWSPVLPAQATPDEVALNGTYRATSDGAWAKLNHQMHTMETVTSIWTIKTTCTSSKSCEGDVSTDQGWTAPITLNERFWLVTHDVEDYARCTDGTTVSGHRHYKFHQVHREDIYSKVNVGDLDGFETTMGPSGTCGNFQWLRIEMPFTLVKIG